MLAARKVGKHYGERSVLSEVSLNVGPGEMVGIIGPNGSGKTTLLRLLSGEERPDTGTVMWEDRPIADWPVRERARWIALLPQEGLPPLDFTVEEVVMMGRHPHQGWWPWITERDRALVEEILADTDLLSHRWRPVAVLSGGERQRVAIAQAMAQQPRLLLLDEPTTYLDVRHQLGMLDRIVRWKRKDGLSVVIVLHDLNLAAQYCDRLLLLKNGRVIREGTPEQVIQASVIRDAYGIDPVMVRHPSADVPQVLLQSEEKGFVTTSCGQPLSVSAP
jgi:iron complex transport system ATP-binding protein